MRLTIAAIVVCLALVVALLHLLRTRRIREKYAAVWILLTLAVVAIGVFPGLAFWLSDLVGVQTPANLLFAMACLVLLAVCIQLSTEVSSLEEETRTLAEEVALLRLDVRQHLVRVQEQLPRADTTPPAERPGDQPRQEDAR
ncbi:DUF2304 domain-containing protein [Cellulomonas pakistanensis]|uniref:DUF2304 domain-containing protein n=1 Tax=Cellulomonas pakistanensis TaxID=992287 RepID=A0A919U6B0_9CELL|nr:DUF2304 domain-containing protein [Cellulomonas pakistanensis]GIG36085.1 hypothetical protein Cpa01nite_14660 [Cellulomonas pakistanensis]